MWEKLGDSDIRLLSIDGPDVDATTSPQTPLRCTLTRVSLKDRSSTWRDFEAQATPIEIHLYNAYKKWCRGRATGGAGKKAVPARFAWGDYHTLSYVWGPESAQHYTILLNGAPFRVRENLYQALLQLRSNGRYASALKLWVDAVCINQDDGAEKAAQVQRMQDVYSTSRHTVIWLGSTLGLQVSDEEYFERVKGILKWADVLTSWDSTDSESATVTKPSRRDVYDNAARLLGDLETANPDGGCITRLGPHSHAHQDLSNNDLLQAVLEPLLGQEYWHRAWVIQEIATSLGQATIRVGRCRLAMSLLQDGAHRLNFPPDGPTEKPGGRFESAHAAMLLQTAKKLMVRRLPSELRRIGATRRTMSALTISRDEGTSPDSLDSESESIEGGKYDEDDEDLFGFDGVWWTLQGVLSCATLPGDKLYGIMGLLDPQVSKHIVVDYSRTAAQVSIDATYAMIREAKHLLNFILLKGAARDPSLPSWSVDIAVDRSRHAGVATMTSYVMDAPGLDLDDFFRQQTEQGVLIMAATHVDTVDGVTAFPFADGGAASKEFLAWLGIERREDLEMTQPLRPTLAYATDIEMINRLPVYMGGYLASFWGLPFLAAEAEGSDYPGFAAGGTTAPAWRLRSMERIKTFIDANKDFRLGRLRLGSLFPGFSASCNDDGARKRVAESQNRAFTLMNRLDPSFVKEELFNQCDGPSMTDRSRVVTTANGHLHMTTPAVRHGDEIFSVEGCGALVVARSVENGYHEFVGLADPDKMFEPLTDSDDSSVDSGGQAKVPEEPVTFDMFLRLR